MDLEKVVLSGNLLLPSQGKIVLKKSWQQKYCVLYKQSKQGIERLEIYDNSDDPKKNLTPKIITLENCIKISPKPPNTFIIMKQNMQYEFNTLHESELNTWIVALQTVAFKDDVSKISSIEEDNDLYCPSGEGVFSVKLTTSDVSQRCHLEPKTYTLVLTSTAIELHECSDNKLLYTWPYQYIRRYGYRNGNFTFEVGRKSETGEGIFYLKHSNEHEIFRCLVSKLKSMRNNLTGESSILDCGDNQLNAALSMEARSRSPLPPSPTSSTRVHDIEASSFVLSNSMRSIDSSEISQLIKSNKSIPSKPPRKNIPNKLIDVEYAQYEVVNNVNKSQLSYDKVEQRHDAWRTLGVLEVEHKEAVKHENGGEQVDYASWAGRKQQIQEIPNTKNTKILSKQSSKDESYDKLNFFGPSGKPSVQPGYKQVMPVSMQTYSPSWNEYDEVEINMQSVRLADDSHLGYAMIRKPSNSPPTNNDVAHKVYNEETYAVVSKPKRV